MNPLFYKSITGRRFVLSKLTKEERSVLAAGLRIYKTNPEWSKFGTRWLQKFTSSRLPRNSPVYRVCQDLEARLGIAQGRVALPDFRDYLADLIEEKYGSRYKFCKDTGIDQAYLSRVLSGVTGLSLEHLAKLLNDLGCVLVAKREGDLRAEAQPTGAARQLRALQSAHG